MGIRNVLRVRILQQHRGQRTANNITAETITLLRVQGRKQDAMFSGGLSKRANQQFA